MNALNDLETVYALTLVSALLLNGIAIVGRTPLGRLLAPLREGRLYLAALSIDLLLIPFVILLGARLLGLEPGVRAGLIIVAAASTGPIGVALVRIARGEVAVSVSLIVAFGASNLVTVPLLLTLLLPQAARIPTDRVLGTMLQLVVIPLALGATLRWAAQRFRWDPDRWQRTIGRAGKASTVLIAVALTTAGLLEGRTTFVILLGPMGLIIIATLVTTGLATRWLFTDPDRRIAVWITLNARAVGLSLAVATLHLASVPDLRATIIAYGGATQLLPIILVVVRRAAMAARAARTASRSPEAAADAAADAAAESPAS